jgi:hypothetical protein
MDIRTMITQLELVKEPETYLQAETKAESTSDSLNMEVVR